MAWGGVGKFVLFIHLKGIIMKTSKLFSLAVIVSLGMSPLAYAKGPGGGQGAQSGGSTGTQAKIHTPGTGLTTGTPTQTRIHVPGTGLGTTSPASGQMQQGAGRGIHTPGTGLTTPAPVPAPVTN